MAVPVCTRASLVAGYACYQNLDPKEFKAMTIYLKALELNAIGGTNYTGAGNLGPGGTLLAAASQFSTMTPEQIDLSMIVVNANNATGAGATVSSNIQTLVQSIKCLKNFDDKMLDQMDLQLTCELGVHKVYPQ